jgi:hypothetical protein
MLRPAVPSKISPSLDRQFKNTFHDATLMLIITDIFSNGNNYFLVPARFVYANKKSNDACSRVVIENLIVLQPVKTFLAFLREP